MKFLGHIDIPFTGLPPTLEHFHLTAIACECGHVEQGTDADDVRKRFDAHRHWQDWTFDPSSLPPSEPSR